MSLRHIKSLTLKNFNTHASRSLIDEISLVGLKELSVKIKDALLKKVFMWLGLLKYL